MKKQKLTYIANLRLPTEKAHSIQIMKMCEAFSLQDVEVELIIPSKRNNLGELEVFKYYGIQKPFKVKRIPSTDLLGGTILFGQLFYWIDLVTFLISLYFKSRIEKGSIIYSRDPILLLPFSWRDYRLVVEIHSLPVRRRFFLKLLSRASIVVVLTKYLKDVLVDSGFSENIITVAPDGVDIKAFGLNLSKEEVRQKLGLPKEVLLVGYVGAFKTMGMEKGIDTALKSFKSFKGKATLVLVGGHETDIEFYKKIARDLAIAERVIFVGRVSPSMVPFYLKSFDVLIAPFPENQHYKYYMSPLKLFEYMASGVPIILSDLPSLREIVDKSSATFFQPGNPEDLAVAINHALNNPEESKKKVDKSLVLAQEHTWIRRAYDIFNFAKRLK